MAVSVEMQHTGDPASQREVAAVIEHVLPTGPGPTAKSERHTFGGGTLSVECPDKVRYENRAAGLAE
jgi:hypothetical protein